MFHHPDVWATEKLECLGLHFYNTAGWYIIEDSLWDMIQQKQ